MRPGWRAGPRVRAAMSLRSGGTSPAPWDGFNLGVGVGDDPRRVAAHRAEFGAWLGARPAWLRQEHGTTVVHLRTPADALADWTADASWTDRPGLACTVQAADCMPVLLAAPGGRAVGAAHAGWRGLAAGVIEAVAAPVCAAAGCAPADLHVWLGPCIGPRAFEVGADVLQAFGASPGRPDEAFVPSPRPNGDLRWRADLVMLARRRLRQMGVRRVSGGRWCTVESPSRFFSFRRDRGSGRMAAAVCIVG